MGTLKASFAFALLLRGAPAAASPVDRWTPHIEEAASRFQIPDAWIRRVMQAESGGRTMLGGRPIRSSAGALGLMQLMPGTWREMRTLHGLGPDPHAPRDNILAGAAYLRLMYERFGYPGLFGAYNAGPARYANHLATGRRLPDETRAYVAAVAGSTRPSTASPSINLTGRAEPPALFIPMSTPSTGERADSAAPMSTPSPLFVRLSSGRAISQ